MGPTYFSDRIPGVTRDQSVQLVTALRALGGLAPDGSVVGWVLDAAAEQVQACPGLRFPLLLPLLLLLVLHLFSISTEPPPCH